MSKVYFLTVEKGFKGGEVVRVLPPTQVQLHYCCRESELGPMLPERYVVRFETTLTRREVKKLLGVVRVRTFEKARYSAAIIVC